MSLINISVHKGYGIVSADTCLSAQLDGEGKPMEDCELTAAGAEAAGHPPAVPTGRMTKIIALPQMQAVAGSMGSLILMSMVHSTFSTFACGDIAEFPTKGREILRQAFHNSRKLFGEYIAEKAGIMTVIAGYSPSRKAVIGWSCNHADGFEMRPVAQPSMNPAVAVDDNNRETWRGLMEAADTSLHGARALHVEIGRSHYDRYEAGKFPAGYHISDEMHVACVTEKAIIISREFVSAPGLVAAARRGAPIG